MPVSEKSLENLKKGRKFSSDYQPEIRGKRRNRLREFIEEERFSLDDLRAILEGLLTSYSFEEIEDMYNKGREDLPALITMFLKAFIVDVKKGSLSSVEIILERIHGKPIHQVILDSIDRAELPADPEERRILAEKLRNELGLGKLPSGAVLPENDQKTENADTD
jgi:hypothetical protein